MLLEILNRIVLCILHADLPYLFPTPLTEEEERACFERLERGDKSAKNTLTAHNLRLVAHIAGKYRGSSEEPEELVSIGTFGLMKAVDTFDYHKGARFSTYAARCVEKPPHTVRLFLNHRRKNKRLSAKHGNMKERSLKTCTSYIESKKERFITLRCMYIRSA